MIQAGGRVERGGQRAGSAPRRATGPSPGQHADRGARERADEGREQVRRRGGGDGRGREQARLGEFISAKSVLVIPRQRQLARLARRAAVRTRNPEVVVRGFRGFDATRRPGMTGLIVHNRCLKSPLPASAPSAGREKQLETSVRMAIDGIDRQPQHRFAGIVRAATSSRSRKNADAIMLPMAASPGSRARTPRAPATRRLKIVAGQAARRSRASGPPRRRAAPAAPTPPRSPAAGRPRSGRSQPRLVPPPHRQRLPARHRRRRRQQQRQRTPTIRRAGGSTQNFCAGVTCRRPGT